jgi:hypothetical protein
MNVGNEIIFNDFNKILHIHVHVNADLHIKNPKLEEYSKNRSNYFSYIHSLLQLDDIEDKLLNFSLLRVKTRGTCILFEIYIYSASEKLKESSALSSLFYQIPVSITELLENFFRKNFVIFFDEFSTFVDGNNEEKDEDNEESDEENENQKEASQSPKNEKNSDVEEAESKKKTKNEDFTYVFSNFKLICESFSRLLILNLGIFKNKNFCSLYFETFTLIKLPLVFRNIISIVYQRIYEKEVDNYRDQIEVSKLDSNPLNILLYYVSKVTIQFFNDKLRLFNYRNFTIDEKKVMISMLWTSYAKCVKDQKINKREIVMKKDKIFYTNFIFNCLVMAFEQTLEVSENEKPALKITNVLLLEFIQIFFKPKTYFDEKDFKQILVSLLKMTEDLNNSELNIVHDDIKVIEKFKKLLVKKAKLYKYEVDKSEIKNQAINENVDEEEDEKPEENNDETDIEKTSSKKEIKKTKKGKRNFNDSGINDNIGKKKKEA